MVVSFELAINMLKNKTNFIKRIQVYEDNDSVNRLYTKGKNI